METKIQQIFEKLTKDFNDKYVWIVSFYKENNGITISDSDLESEIKCDTECKYEKFILEYNLQFKFEVKDNHINFKINEREIYHILFNQDFYYNLDNNKTIWICGRDYQNNFN